MRGVILAAGLGTRLRPLTDTVPKCLVEVGGSTLLDRWLDAFSAAGIHDVLVNVHHLAEQVERHLAGRTTPRVVVAREETLLGSAGTLRANRAFLTAEGPFLAVNADNLTDYDLASLRAAHARSGALATIATFHTPTPTRAGILEVEDGRVVAFEEKPAVPRSDLANAGIYLFEPEVLDLITGPGPLDIGLHLLPQLVGRATAVALSQENYFHDIGTPAALAEAKALLSGVPIP